MIEVTTSLTFSSMTASKRSTIPAEARRNQRVVIALAAFSVAREAFSETLGSLLLGHEDRST